MVALYAMRNCVSSTPRLQALLTQRLAWMEARGVREAAERIGSKSNLWADLGSRGRINAVVEQAAQLGLAARRVEPPAGWQSPDWLLGLPLQ